MSEEYNLIPALDESGDETGYFTREPDGTSGMTVSALAGLCATSQPAVTQLLNKIREADPITNDLPDCLKHFAGQDLRLITNDPQGRVIIPDEACSEILDYYAFVARAYKGQKEAKENFRSIAKAGMRIFIWAQTGYIPPILRDSLKAHTSAYIERLENAFDHEIDDELWSVFAEGARTLLLVEKQMRVPVDKMDLCDGSIGRRWSQYREGKEWCDKVGTYTHSFRDQRGDRFPAAYQLTELPYFRKWLRDQYEPYHLPKYLVDKFGKRATKEIYRFFGAITPRVEEVTYMARKSKAEDRKYAEFQQLKQQLLKEQIAEAESEQLALPLPS